MIDQERKGLSSYFQPLSSVSTKQHKGGKKQPKGQKYTSKFLGQTSRATLHEDQSLSHSIKSIKLKAQPQRSEICIFLFLQSNLIIIQDRKHRDDRRQLKMTKRDVGSRTYRIIQSNKKTRRSHNDFPYVIILTKVNINLFLNI